MAVVMIRSSGTGGRPRVRSLVASGREEGVVTGLSMTFLDTPQGYR